MDNLWAMGVAMMSSVLSGQGQVVSEAPVFSPVLGTNRMVRVYVPPSYARSRTRRYPVLYVHDGQNAFTTAGADVAFGWGNWALDRTVNDLVAERRMQEIIMVAIDCSRRRYQEYRGPSPPASSARRRSPGRRRSPTAPGESAPYELYARFLIEELKPRIDRQYRTRRGPKHCGVLGSSMGGICSLALAWEHPKVFGLAASLSGAFQVERRYFLEAVLGRHQGHPKPLRLYLDSGVIDYSGGDDGRRDTTDVADALRRIGYRDGADLMHFVELEPMNEAASAAAGLRRDKWPEAMTNQHNEFYWRQRAWRALTFLFPPPP